MYSTYFAVAAVITLEFTGLWLCCAVSNMFRPWNIERRKRDGLYYASIYLSSTANIINTLQSNTQKQVGVEVKNAADLTVSKTIQLSAM